MLKHEQVHSSSAIVRNISTAFAVICLTGGRPIGVLFVGMIDPS
jgi:hypothetical protein